MRRLGLLFCLLFATVPVAALAADLTIPPTVLRREGDTGEIPSRKLILPYAFATESLGFAAGAAAGASAWPSEHSSLFGAGMATSNKSAALYLVGTSMRVFGANRWYLDSSVSLGWFTHQRLYVDGNPEFPGGESGSNESDPENFLEGEGWNNWLVLNFKYVMPTGRGRDRAIQELVLDRGLPVEGTPQPSRWNPARSGRTLLQFEPFLLHRTIESEEDQQEQKGVTTGLTASVLYDNRDFPANPSRGSATTLSAAFGAGLNEGSQSWSNLRGKYSKYLSLGQTSWARQQVVALNAWTAYTPTWDDDEFVAQEYDDRPPPSMGASLGGFLRLRGFPLYRFQDKAAIYYGAEYRMIPEWNPLGTISWLRWLSIDWWQFVPFVEVGRVAPDFDLSELHSDMKWDAGIGVRLMAALVVVRLDTAYSEEGFHIWAMVSQAF